MSLSFLITINVLADIALLGGLAYAMSRAKRLTPHVASVQAAQSRAGLELAPPRHPASAELDAPWRSIAVDLARGLVARPPGVKLDSGGLAKGLFADVLAERLAGHASFAINCAGDLSIGGSDGISRPIEVESPFDGSTLHTFNLSRTGVATSGIGRRSWIDRDGRPAHHLLDPASGRPAFTGIVQVTALAPSALMAEIHAIGGDPQRTARGGGLAAARRRDRVRRRLPPSDRAAGRGHAQPALRRCAWPSHARERGSMT
jgi:hypothetical protein